MSAKDGKMKIIELIPGYDLALADLIRFNLKKHHLIVAAVVKTARHAGLAEEVPGTYTRTT